MPWPSTKCSRVAVGVTGGKDSLTALYAPLALLRRYLPFSYHIAALSVDLGFPDADWVLSGFLPFPGC
jgi:tRNA(Ile)-lysidine synthase TilS/MesJ